MWRREDGGVEHVAVTPRDDGGVEADGVAVWREGGERRIRYRLRCDAAWRVREVRVDAPEDGTSLQLECDGRGAWRSGGIERPDLRGCVDVDLYAVAFTNTLPVRRLGMAVGDTAVIDVAYVRLPSMQVEHVQQRYTRVSDDLYRYESLDSGFTAVVSFDADGLVVDYPGLVRRMWPR